MHSLPIFIALKDRPVIVVGDGPAAAAKRALLARVGARIVGEDQQAAFAIVALESDEDAEAAVMRLRARGVLINAVDRPQYCDFTIPAIVDRDPVLIAIGTGGASAGLAAALRQRLEALLPSGLGRLATALHDARGALRARFPEAADRRRAIGGLLAPGGPLDPLADHADPAAEIDAASPVESGVRRVTIASADPDDLTLRAARLIGQADRLYHPPDMPAAILARARADAVLIVGMPPETPPPGLSLELVWA